MTHETKETLKKMFCDLVDSLTDTDVIKYQAQDQTWDVSQPGDQYKRLEVGDKAYVFKIRKIKIPHPIGILDTDIDFS